MNEIQFEREKESLQTEYLLKSAVLQSLERDLAAFDAALDDRILHSSYRKAEHALSKKTSNDTDAEGNSGNYQKRWLNHWS